MLLGGLWHGASWNFVIWGGIHGTMLCLERALGSRHLATRLPRLVAVPVTFVVVLFTWVFFRAPTLSAALGYCGRMLGLGPAAPAAGLLGGVVGTPYHLVCFLAAGVLVWGAPQTWDFTRRITAPKAALVLAVFALALAALTTQSYNPFIYFIF
jgi:alginate O-acetyltransferase complex protein AlgI